MNMDPVATRMNYVRATAVIKIPVVPVATIEVTDPNLVHFNPLSAAQIVFFYARFHTPNLCMWNVQNMDASQWAAARSVLV